MAEVAERPARRPRGEVAEGKGQQRESNSKDVDMTTEKDGKRTDTSATLAPLTEASAQDWLGNNQDPDVMLAVPNLGVDHIGIKVDNLRAHVELHAKVLDLLELHVGAQVSIDEVEIDIDNVRVQAMLKVRLNEVYKIVDRVMTTIDENPEILTNLTGGLGKGLEGALEGGTNVEKGDDQQDQQDQQDGGSQPPSD